MPNRRPPSGAWILLVDDDDEVRRATQTILEEDGYNVVAARNGREALEILRCGARPQLVLLDLMMPEMNGWEFLEAVVERNLQIIVISAHVTDAKTISAAALVDKPAGFLRKPLDPARLLEVARAAMH